MTRKRTNKMKTKGALATRVEAADWQLNLTQVLELKWMHLSVGKVLTESRLADEPHPPVNV